MLRAHLGDSGWRSSKDVRDTAQTGEVDELETNRVYWPRSSEMMQHATHCPLLPALPRTHAERAKQSTSTPVDQQKLPAHPRVSSHSFEDQLPALDFASSTHTINLPLKINTTESRK